MLFDLLNDFWFIRHLERGINYQKTFFESAPASHLSPQPARDRCFPFCLHLITHIRKNMKTSLMHLRDKILLRKRALIETIKDELKYIVQIEHTRHRSVGGFAANLMIGMAA